MWRVPLGCTRNITLAALLASTTLANATSSQGQTRIIEQSGVRLEYAAAVPDADVTFALGQAVYARTVVPRFLHRAPPRVLRVKLVDAERIPFTDESNTIWVPYGRLKGRRPGVDPLSLVHETTHVVASGPRGRDRMLTEGLAVYVQDAIGPQGYPNFGTDLHRATVDLQTKVGHPVALLDSERIRRASDRGDERTLAYTQEGSFARFLIETYGLSKFLALLDGGEPTRIYSRDWGQLEKDWRTLLGTFASAPPSDDAGRPAPDAPARNQ